VKLKDVGEIIARRKLYVDGTPRKEAAVLIGKPCQFSESPDYYCPYQIVGVGNERVMYAGGVDAIQALEETMAILPTELEVLFRAYPTLRWEDAPPGDLGFRSKPRDKTEQPER
jgi:hypothetical protein